MSRAWWALAGVNALLAVANLIRGHFWDGIATLAFALALLLIIIQDREIRDLRRRPRDTEYFVIRPPS